MAKHRQPLTPTYLTIRMLAKVIMALAGIQARVIRYQGRENRLIK